MPKLSVIIACHNSAKFLDEAINSVLCQTLRDLELILIDDCSTDNTLDIASCHELEDARVKVISLPKNVGPAAARNAGIHIAKGEWIGILDSDDVAMPARFEEQMNLAGNEQDFALIASSSISIDQDGLRIKTHSYPTDHEALVRRLRTLQAFPSHSSMVYRSELVNNLIGFNSRYPVAEDYDLWLRLSELGKVASCDRPLVKIRRHETNISDSDEGELSIRFGAVAVTGHFLRIQGCPDPAASNDEEAWHYFVAWIDGRIAEEGLYARRKAWAAARKQYFSSTHRVSGVFRFGTSLLLSSHAILLIWEKIFGSSLPRRLAKEWMGHANAFVKT